MDKLLFIYPEIFISISIMFLLILGVFKKNSSSLINNLSILGLAGSIILILNNPSNVALVIFNESYKIDFLSTFMKTLTIIAGIFILITSSKFLKIFKIFQIEYPILILSSILGMMVMISSNDLIVFYIGLELQSLALYVLAAMKKDSKTSSEAGLKYFILGSIASGFLLFGVSLIFGITGPTTFTRLALSFSQFDSSSPLLVFAIIMILAVRPRASIPGRWQILAELSYEFIARLVSDNIGKDGKPYFSFIFSLFMFVLFCNMMGMIPYTFTVTSHIIVTFVLAAFIFIGVTIIGFIKHGLGYLKLFVPSGVPMVLLPLIVIIEIISYLSRPISLSVRLFANMMAGHTMMKVFGGFVVSLGIVGGWLPLGFSVALTGLEILVAFLQAYVFAILTCIYLNDALNLHH